MALKIFSCAFWTTLALLQYSDAFITYVVPNQPLEGEPAPPGSPWPLPSEWINSTDLFTLDPNNFYLQSNLTGCDVIEQNLKAYRSYIFIDTQHGKVAPNKTVLAGLKLLIAQKCEATPIKFYADESYRIVIAPGVEYAELESETIWGALRALETFSQLVWQDDDGSYLINETTIVDEPRFSHRGVLLDSARHFLPKSILLQNLDAMQWNKMNVFHWHLTDDQAFTYESKKYPNISALGAYMPSHVYTQDDIADVIEYARIRGIRVIPELDSPGHTKAIQKSFPDLITPCYTDGEAYKPDYPNYSDAENFNPSNPDVYDFMREILSEIQGVFKDEFVHLGMDEVSYACWKTNPNITTFMEEQGFPDNYTELENYYVRQVTEIADNLTYKYITWQDPVEMGVNLTKQAIVHIWKDTYLDSSMQPWREYIEPIAQKGYTLLLSSCWYLNYISYGQDWMNYYSCDPQDFNGTQEEKDLVKGGEVTMWGEYVDGSNIIARLWPRSSAVAERLWSPEYVTDNDTAAYRLDQQRCRMLRRGLQVQPILDGYCGDYEWGQDIPSPPSTTAKPGGSPSVFLHKTYIFVVTALVIGHLFYYTNNGLP